MNAYVTISPEAAELRAGYDAEGMSNPIGIFACPHCERVGDVEYGTIFLDFPSEKRGALGPDHVEAARCFRCDGVSYWRLVDFDEEYRIDAGRDWRDFTRELLYPKPEHLRTAPNAVPQPRAAIALAPSEGSEAAPNGKTLLSVLGELYLGEQETNLAPASIRDMKSAFKTLAEALTDPETGVELDLKHHTREDMVNLKSKLMDGRKPLTVNKLLTRLNTLVTWAINSGYLEKAFNKGLKISKGAESGRKAFTEEQIQTLMDQMAQLPVSSWKRWAMSLGVITGGRISEIYQLTKADVLKIGDVVVVSINDNESKTLKNKHSNRLVPLVDGAYGFDLKAFLEYVDSCEGKLFDRVAHNFTRVLNETLRDTLQHDSGEGLTYHSLRHSLAGLMKYHGVQMEFAQSIMGHSSQSITFDLYGGSQQVGVQKLEAALKVSFRGVQA